MSVTEFMPVYYAAMGAWYASNCTTEYPHVEYQLPGDTAWGDEGTPPTFEPGVSYRLKPATV